MKWLSPVGIYEYDFFENDVGCESFYQMQAVVERKLMDLNLRVEKQI